TGYILAQGQGLLAAQQRATSVGQSQTAEPIQINFRQPAGDQLAKHRAPVLLAPLLADTVGRQVLMPGGTNLLVVPAQQDIHQMAAAVTLAAAIDGGQRPPRRRPDIPGGSRLPAIIAVAAGLLENIAKIAKQGLAAAGGDFAQRQHGVELVPLDALVPLITVG